MLKLVYIANRRTLREIGSPIIGREVLAMKHGPVVNGLYQMIRQRSGATLWNEHFSRTRTFGKYNVQLVKEPGDSLLSPYERQVLEDVGRLDDLENIAREIEQEELLNALFGAGSEGLRNNPVRLNCSIALSRARWPHSTFGFRS